MTTTDLPAKPSRSNVISTYVFLIILMAIVSLIVVNLQQWRNEQNALLQEQTTAEPIRPTPDAWTNTQTHQTTYSAPSTEQGPAYPFVLPQGTQGAWEPSGAAIADIGGRQYQDLGNGYVELDDGTRIWVVTEPPAPVVEAPQAAQAAQWVQPVSELQPPVVVETAAQAGKGLEKVSDILLRGGK